MPDREKIIKALSCAFGHSWSGCAGCEYKDTTGVSKDCDFVQLYSDVLELLREQEPVRPTREFSEDIENCAWWYACGVCKRAIDYKDGYCRHCGRAVKWDD